ncbi:MAG: aminotransferase class V-fold PLP-dependent enzyme, partial [Candidatus Bathyarchaeia archaeon]
MSIYERMFGFKRIINASGTMTALGGSLMPPEVVEAMNEAAKEWVRLPDLLDAAERRIAELAGVEACFISSGCAACMTLATAACITGKDRLKMLRLPNTEGMKNELIWQRGHYPSYAAQFTAAGAKLILVGGEGVVLDTPDLSGGGKIPALRTLGVTSKAVEEAVTEKTFAFAYTIAWMLPQRGLLPLDEFCHIAHKHDLPVIVDAASELPYLTDGRFDLGRFNRMGADIVCFSGGKAMRGPNDTGIALGRRDIVEAAKMQANPNSGIGRGFKVSKEQVVGLLVAVERCFRLDWNQVIKEEQARAEHIVDVLRDVPHVKPEIVFPDETGLPVARVWLRLDEKALGITANELMEKMREGDPPIFLRGGYTNLGIVI